MAFSGPWQQVVGRVGEAVEFTAATSLGVALGTESQNPGADDFAMSETFTSQPIPAGVGYSGNVMQKGLFGDPGQIKMQLVPTNGGTVSCRIKGTNGAKMLGSRVLVGDGAWHTATCWREGASIGLTVDGVTKSVQWDPGSIANRKRVTIGNKSATADWTDQHLGSVDCSVYTIGAGARNEALSLINC